MIGRDVLPSVQKHAPSLAGPVLELRDVHAQSDRGIEALRGVTFEVNAGEIVGIAGVEGNGQSELVDTITGLRPPISGQIIYHDRSGKTIALNTQSPKAIRRAGVSCIPEDRRERGLILPYSVADNLILGIEGNSPFSHAGVFDRRAILANAKRLIPRFDIRPPRPDVAVGTLSGGNQQKVVLAREFTQDPRLLIASQPTRGLDVGAAEFVHSGLVEKRDQGVGILLVSAELDEIMEFSDRIIVLYEGRVMGIFAAGSVDENRLGLLMTGGEQPSEAIDLTSPGLKSGDASPQPSA